MTDTMRGDDGRARPDGVSPSVPAPPLPGTSPAAALPPATPSPRSSGTAVVSELLDRAIQRIFTAGLLLNSAAQRSTPEVAASIEQATSDLDDALRDIRATALTSSAVDPSSTSFSEARPSP